MQYQAHEVKEHHCPWCQTPNSQATSTDGTSAAPEPGSRAVVICEACAAPYWLTVDTGGTEKLTREDAEGFDEAFAYQVAVAMDAMRKTKKEQAAQVIDELYRNPKSSNETRVHRHRCPWCRAKHSGKGRSLWGTAQSEKQVLVCNKCLHGYWFEGKIALRWGRTDAARYPALHELLQSILTQAREQRRQTNAN